MKTLLVKAILTGMKRYTDSTVGYTFRTMEEIPNDQFALSDQYFQQNGWMAFKMNDMQGTDIPDEAATVEGMETPSQYLRRCLFALHMANGGTTDSFQPYYNRAMAGFAEAVKRKFPDRKDS